MKNSLLLYYDWEGPVSLLSDEQAGALFKAIFAYEKRGEEPPGDPAVLMAFTFIRSALDENRGKYEAKAQRNRLNGARGGRPRGPENPDGFSGLSEKPQKAVSGSDSDSDSGSDSGSGSDSASVSPKGERARGAPFTPPTPAEVAAYVAERGSLVVPQEFIDFYEAKGWMVGKTPMKDWKAACRNAEKWDRWSRTAPSATGPAPHPSRPSFTEIAARMKGDGTL